MIQAQIVDRLSVEEFLALVVLFPHQDIKIIVEDEVFKFSQLHGQQLANDFLIDIVTFRIFEIRFHKHALLELTGHHKNILILDSLVWFSKQEFLVAILDEVTLIMIDIIDFLILHADHSLRLLVHVRYHHILRFAVALT